MATGQQSNADGMPDVGALTGVYLEAGGGGHSLGQKPII